jgi:protein-S-isoprenylcysteine O-methyltransferase Ste14
MHIASSSPTPPYHKKNCQYLFESWVHRIGFFLRVRLFDPVRSMSLTSISSQLILWTETTADVALTVLTTRSLTGMSGVERWILGVVSPLSSESFPRLQPSCTFVLGAIVLILSGALRHTCYKKLGKLFTFEVAIQPGHKIITTGPYAYVRHPSYLSAVSACASASVVMLSRGAFAREYLLARPIHWVGMCVKSCDGTWSSTRSCMNAFNDLTLLEAAALVVLTVWALCAATVTRNVLHRLEWEEDVLQREFGKEWLAYTKVVRWRMIPGLL